MGKSHRKPTSQATEGLLSNWLSVRFGLEAAVSCIAEPNVLGNDCYVDEAANLDHREIQTIL